MFPRLGDRSSGNQTGTWSPDEVLVSTPSKNFTAADYPALAAALGIGSNTTQLLCVARVCAGRGKAFWLGLLLSFFSFLCLPIFLCFLGGLAVDDT